MVIIVEYVYDFSKHGLFDGIFNPVLYSWYYIHFKNMVLYSFYDFYMNSRIYVFFHHGHDGSTQAGAARRASLRKRGAPMDPSWNKDGWAKVNVEV